MTTRCLILSLVLAFVTLPLLADDKAADLLEKARSSFHTIESADVELGRKELSRRLTTLQQNLGRSAERFVGWDRYLDFEEQERQLAADKSDVEYWYSLLNRVARNHPGLELPVFVEYREALRRFINLSTAAKNENFAEEFKQHLALLDSNLPAPDKATTEDLEDIRTAVDFLARYQQAPQLVAHLRTQYGRPNFFVTLSSSKLNRVFERDIQEPFTNQDVLGGARVTGSGTVRGRLTAEPIKSNAYGAMRVLVQGNSTSQNVSTKSSMRVHTTDSLNFTSSARVYFSQLGFSAYPFQTNGRLDSRITRINNPYGAFRREAADRQARAGHAQNRSEAQRRAIDRVTRDMTSQLQSRLRELNRNYRRDVLDPLKRYGQTPTNLTTYHEPDGLTVSATLAHPWQLGGTIGPKMPWVDDGIRIACHESALNNLVGARLGGRSRALQEVLSDLEIGGQEHAADELLFAMFDQTQPLEVRFREGRLTVRINAQEFRYQEKTYAGGAIQFAYAAKQSDNGWDLVLQDDVAVQINGGGFRNVAWRRTLNNLLKRDLQQMIDVREVKLSGGLQRLEKMRTAEIVIRDGWLVVLGR